jgi:hypothetical protein
MKGHFMKPALKLLIASLVLLTQGFAQEPKKAIVPQDSSVLQSRDQVIATGTAQRPAPVVQPKALPTLSPSLGDIARAARAAHAAAPKAQVVVAEDAPAQK